MSRSHIAFGFKDDIPAAIKAKKIPKNCLIVTRVTDPYEESELFYYDKFKELHQLSTRDIFPSKEVAEEWVQKYYCIGRHFIINEADGWHTYVINENNELILRDGSDKVAEIIPGDESISVGGTQTAPTVAVVIDAENSGGLSAGENGIKLATATRESAGAMSAADKTKLDGIEDGAEVNTIRNIMAGSAKGTISVNGVDIPITGLGSAAFTDSYMYQPIGTGMNYSIVDELPGTGRTDTIYLLKNKGEDDNFYDEYLFVNKKFELVGTTKTDLSDYYTIAQANEKVETDITNVKSDISELISRTSSDIREEVSHEISQKVNMSDLSRVATSGSYSDLNNAPPIPTILNCIRRPDGYYYPSITFGTAINMLSSGAQIAVYYPENNMVYQCTLWKSDGRYIYFGVQDEFTYRTLRWDRNTERISVYGSTQLLSSDILNSYYSKEEIDMLLNNKVDVVNDKQLSSEDYTHDEKIKLSEFEPAELYALKSDIEQVYRYKGSVTSYNALPSDGNRIGDVFDTEDTGIDYVWTGESWDAIGGVSDVQKITNSDINEIIA